MGVVAPGEKKYFYYYYRISLFDCKFIFPCYDTPIDNTQFLRLAVWRRKAAFIISHSLKSASCNWICTPVNVTWFASLCFCFLILPLLVLSPCVSFLLSSPYLVSSYCNFFISLILPHFCINSSLRFLYILFSMSLFFLFSHVFHFFVP